MEQITKRFMSWASILEDNTRTQVAMTSEMPFIHPHVTLMPDAHLGKGCAVDAVLPTLGAIAAGSVGARHPPTRREVNSCGWLQVGVQQEDNSRVCT